MSFADLYDSGFRQRNEDHFAAIVRVAMDDGVISNKEKAFLDRLARNLSISAEDYEIILKDYMSHPINPPTTYDRRLERLYDLTRMVHIDHEFEEEEPLLERLAIGLGFNTKNASYVVHKALTLVEENADLDTFQEEIKNMNR
ncbi:tellurite resistance TerB family protein [Dokdonia donghaensis]|uniref:Fructose 1,6-bisphosphatase n=1 Tax=Dokdonia donghaensis DSW-1 TaxID=1300343 RepID=A0A0A2H299_9FLAO|nr:fructose 1,6-bisphosphatase [Dokdonia donghaensis]ANH59370.1 Tellurite resistance protein TerB [Dokdonia donghaensis DSW-1]KGO06765.1 fructose 1,6-bisphosphatase [Dokdonia donghaensis DSW-1]